MPYQQASAFYQHKIIKQYIWKANVLKALYTGHLYICKWMMTQVVLDYEDDIYAIVAFTTTL